MIQMKEFACFLPGLQPEDVGWETLSFMSQHLELKVMVPVLTPVQTQALIERVRHSRRSYLQSLRMEEIVTIVDRVVSRLLDANDPVRQKANMLLPVVTGYDPEMVRLGLTHFLKNFRKPQLWRFLAEDFSNPLILDEFQPRAKGGFSKAFGADLITHVWAGNVPGLVLWSLISGLLVKSGGIGKVSSAEPLLAGWFAQLLAEEDPRLGACLAVVWWRGGDEIQEKLFFQCSSLVLAYGSNDTLESIKSRIPLTTRFLPFGHKLSFGMVAREALDARKGLRTAQLAAFDVMRFDQQGCYSPQVLFIERGGKLSPEDFARYLAHELACYQEKYPRRKLALEESTQTAQWLQNELIASASQTGKSVNSAFGWSVVFNSELETLSPSALNRTIRVIAVDHLAQVIPLISTHRIYLQTVGLAAEPKTLFQLSELLGAAGVTRICALGQMTAPESGWHHDGRFSLLDLTQMVDIEVSAEQSAETFAHYTD